VLVSVVLMNYVLSVSISFITATALNCLLSVQHVFLPGRFSRRLEFAAFLPVKGLGLGLHTSSQSVLGRRS
jgi:hypothetical protein